MKTYGLYVKVEGSSNLRFTLEESLRDDRKRNQLLMDSHLIEDLDRMTSKFTSFRDLIEAFQEVNNTNKSIYEPVIIVDKDEIDRSRSYPLFDIVYTDDQEMLNNKDSIRTWLLEYLINNPNDIKEFRGIKDIYQNVREKYKDRNINYLINITILIYFENHNYKRYREAYFKLKELDRSKVKKNEIHR